MSITAGAYIGGAAIIGGAQLIGGLYSAWKQDELARELAESEIKSSERLNELNIKFAREESEREESRFARTHALQKKGFNLQKAQTNFNNTQQILNNLSGMMNNNRQARNNFINFNRTRQ